MRLLKEIRNSLGNYHVKSGIYHYYRGEFKPAVDFFRKALEADENLTDGDRRTARYYLTMALTESAERLERKGELEEAALELERASEVSPEYPDIRVRRGHVLERLERPDDAIAQYRGAIAGNPRYLDAWVSLGFCLLRADRRDESEKAFTEACELKLSFVRSPFDRGVERLREGLSSEASDYFRQTFHYDPREFERHYRAALEHLKAETYDAALEHLEEALRLNPRYPDLYNFQGIALCELGRLDEALTAFRRSSSIRPGFLIPRLNLAFAMLRGGMFKDAEAELEAILRDDPTEPAALAKLEELRSGGGTEKRRSPSRGKAR